MKGNKWLVLGIMALTFGLTHPASAWVLVGPLGDTGPGWRTFSINLKAGTYTAGFVVSNQGDSLMYSWLLLDNLSHGENPSFEKTPDYDGYTLAGYGEIKDSFDAPTTPNVYMPKGSKLSYQESYNGVDTSFFKNKFGQDGTVGSILETEIKLDQNGVFSFQWAFGTLNTPSDDPPPVGYDFALFYLKDSYGKITTYGLAQVVPVPATLLLFGSGLLGLAGIGLRRKKRV